MNHPAETDCLNCGEKLHGEYCARCGQSAHDGRSPTLGHFGHELLHEFSHLDGKIFRTVKALLLRPGLLTAEYWHGRISSWVRPLRIFLIVIAINLLVVHDGAGPMNFHIGMSKDARGTTNIQVSPRAGRHALAPKFAPVPEAERVEFFSRFRTAYSSVRYTSVALFALGTWLLFRKRQRFYANHLIAGLHFYSFWYLLAAVSGSMEALSIPSGIAAGTYLVLTIRRLFHTKWFETTVKCTLLMVWIAAIEMGLAILAMFLVQRGLVWGGH